MTEETPELTEREQAESIAREAIENNRPLSATAGRNLLKIVENDFASIRADLQLFLTEELARIQQEESSGVSEETKQELAQEYREMRGRWMAEEAIWYNEVRALGLNTGNIRPLSHVLDISFTDDALQRRIVEKQKAVREQVQLARELAEREFRKAERMVLLATVTGQAEKVLTAIPSASDLMGRALEERQTRRAIPA